VRRLATTLVAIGLTTLAAPSAQAATYEQVGCFAGSFPGLSESCKPVAEEKFSEEVQLGGVSGMAVNYTGAGGVAKGTVYAATKTEGFRIAMFTPKAEGGLEFNGSWQVTNSGGAYNRCGPTLEVKCEPRAKTSARQIDVEVDQATGNVYVLNGEASPGQKMVIEYDADGSKEITRFGERAAGGKTAETPTQIHGAKAGGLAINGAGEVYVSDLNTIPFNEYHRLMVFKPKTPGDYSEYEYAGDVAGGFNADGNIPSLPVTDAAGNVYVAGEEFIEMYHPEAPQAYPAPPATVACHVDKLGLTAMTVNPLTGEPFFYLNRRESKVKWVRQLGPCEGGTFKETGKVQVIPERGEIFAMAVDPTQRFQPSRPKGILYAGTPLPVPDFVGTGEPGQSSLGYIFAPPQGAITTKTLTVSKLGTGTGTVTSEPAGIDCGSKCSAEFEEGSTVTLSAKAAAGSTFAGWSGSGCSGTGTCKVTMSEAKAVSAEFTKAGPTLHTLKVSVSGEGSVSADAGTISGCTSAGGAACEGQYEEGAVVTLTETPKAGSIFKGWGSAQCDESTESTCVVTIGSADEGVSASFEAEPEEEGIPLTVSVQGPGTVSSDVGLISCNPFCSDEYKEGTKVTLTASPNSGSLFMAWKHCDTGAVNGRQCTVTMSKAKEVTAVFLTAHALTVSKADGSGPGKLTAYGAITCPYACTDASALLREGASVTVSQTPARHFHFAGWEGDCSGTGACELSMGEDHEVSALFQEDPKLSLSLTKQGGGQALIKSKPAGILCGFTCFSAGASFYEGEAITLSWKLNKGTTRLTWSKGAGTCTGSSEALEGSCTVSMSAAVGLAATLE